MNTQIEHTRGTACTIEEMMQVFRGEDKEALLNHIEYLLYNTNENEVNDLYEELLGFCPTQDLHVPYDESESTNDFYENGDLDDIDPAGGHGLHSHI
jgi:hypothetical protein